MIILLEEELGRPPTEDEIKERIAHRIDYIYDMYKDDPDFFV